MSTDYQNKNRHARLIRQWLGLLVWSYGLRHDRDTHERGVTVRLRTAADLDLRLAELRAKVARKHDLGKRTTHWRRRRPGRKAARAVEEILKTPAKGSMGGLLRPSDDTGMFLQWIFEVPIEKEDPREPLARSTEIASVMTKSAQRHDFGLWSARFVLTAENREPEN